ncbi:MAG: Rieske 2Fe-2S domain-containing protein [Acidimicrobiia bacterium]
MKVPFTWRPTGWFMIGFSAEFEPGKVKPLKYFGQDLVAYRTEDGKLNVLDAHCPHLGAHLGHRGKVNGDCVECPYHGWGFGPDGVNKYIPYEDRPNVSKSLRSWPVQEQHEWVFMWHDPAGGPPRWEMPSVWEFDDVKADPSQFYRGYPELSVKYPGEPVHPQIPLENGPDTEHFHYVHNATVHPRLLEYSTEGPIWRTKAGWPIPTEDGGERFALMIYGHTCGVGGSFTRFEGSARYRLAFFTTPVDEGTSDMWYTIWWPRDEGDDSVVVPEHHRERATKDYLITLWDDLEIWRYQVYVENPALAQQDAKPYGTLRKWARQFYEVEPTA